MKNKINIPKLFFGCLKLGLNLNLKNDLHILDYAYERGVTGYDTSLSYGYGRSIDVLSKFIQNKRGNIFISSKIGILPPKNANLYLLAYKLKEIINIQKVPKIFASKIKSQYSFQRFDKQTIVQHVEKTLFNLKTQYIDLLSLHHVSKEDINDENIYCLNKLVDSGKIRNFGFAPAENYQFFINKKVNYLHLTRECFFENKNKITESKYYLIHSIYGSNKQIKVEEKVYLQSAKNISIIISMFNKNHIDKNIELFS